MKEQPKTISDNKRLGKQRVETYQIISDITRKPKLGATPYEQHFGKKRRIYF